MNNHRSTSLSLRFRLAIRIVLTCCSMLPLSTRALDPGKSVYQFNTQNWTRQQGLSANTITAITQTADGYLWLGTAQGLVRFDGEQFEPVGVDFPGAGGHGIRTLVPAKDGGLWLSITHGGLASFDGATFSPIADPRWSDSAVTGKAFMEASDGAVWTGSNLGFGRWVKGKPDESFVSDATARVFAICEDPRGRIWLGTQERGLFYYENGAVNPATDASLQQEIISALAAEADGRIWVGTQTELRCYDAEGLRLPLPPMRIGINALLIDRQGVLWVATFGSGLARFHEGKFTFLRQTDGLASDSVEALFEDAEGSLWVGTREGLSQLSDLKFPILSEKEGIARGEAHTVSASQKGGLWITSGGGLSYYDGKSAQKVGAAQLSNFFIKLGFEARSGDFYFVDGTKTISVLSDGEVIRRFANNRWPEAFAEDDHGVLVGMGETLCRIGPAGPEPYVFDEGSPGFGYIDNLCVARDGSIWLASYNGIFRIHGRTWQRWSAADGSSVERAHFIFEDADLSIWAALETGLVRIKNGQIANIRAEHGLHDDRVYAIVPDDLGYFWMDSSSGLFRVTRQSLNDFADGRATRIACEVFEGSDSVKFAERIDLEYSGCKTADGRIWFPNNRGVVTIDPANIPTNPLPPPIAIKMIKVNGRELVDRGRKQLSVGDDRVEFFFAALSYIAPQKVRIRYQLEGFDSTWIDAGTRRSVLFNLKPGQYTFRLQAANAAGVWNNTGAEYRFEIPPAFYQTGWFYLLVTVLGSVMFVGIYRWQLARWKNRQRKLQDQNSALERNVAERTAELASSLSLLQTTLDATPDGILTIQCANDAPLYNRRFTDMWELAPAELVNVTNHDLILRNASLMKDPQQFLARIEQMRALPDKEAYDVLELKNGKIFERTCRPQRFGNEIIGVVINFHDITERRRAEAALETLNKQLLDTSRQAGMAEVATSVLHNVGNVLNSVNVSATLLADQVRDSKADRVGKLRDLLRANESDLEAFVRSERGRLLPGFLDKLANELAAEQKEMLGEVDLLRKNVEHIKEIVAMQQNYAQVSGMVETIRVSELVEDAVRMNSASFARDDVKLVRDFRASPVITIDKHKVLQILVNLIRNAKQACDDSGQPDPQITIQITDGEGHVQVAVIDNGIGVTAGNLTRIFAHGFTTKSGGHGFGLHNGALAAQELDGSLTVRSDGPGKGATFTLELPLNPVAPATP